MRKQAGIVHAHQSSLIFGGKMLTEITVPTFFDSNVCKDMCEIAHAAVETVTASRQDGGKSSGYSMVEL